VRNTLQYDLADGPEIGLIISSVLPLTTMLQWVTRQSAELENQLVSVERIEQFIELEPENDVEDFGNYSGKFILTHV